MRIITTFMYVLNLKFKERVSMKKKKTCAKNGKKEDKDQKKETQSIQFKIKKYKFM